MDNVLNLEFALNLFHIYRTRSNRVSLARELGTGFVSFFIHDSIQTEDQRADNDSAVADAALVLFHSIVPRSYRERVIAAYYRWLEGASISTLVPSVFTEQDASNRQVWSAARPPITVD